MWIKAKTFVFGNLRICFCADSNTLDHPMMIISTNTHSLFFLPCVCSVARRATMPTNALKAILPSWVDSNLRPRGHHSAVAEPPPPLLKRAEEEQQRRGCLFAPQAEVELKDFNCHCCVFTWLQTQAVGKIQQSYYFYFCHYGYMTMMCGLVYCFLRCLYCIAHRIFKYTSHPGSNRGAVLWHVLPLLIGYSHFLQSCNCISDTRPLSC